MEKQQLPNSTLILVFGILSIVTCCCYGILGLIFGIVAMVMAKKAKEQYMANPEIYTGYKNVTTGRILAIIGIVLSAIYLVWSIYLFSTLGYEGIQQMQQDMLEQYGG
ncbi:CCC motif membrane protein [Croceiramulus getboli]|nr:CCC motif membrane protein [Flavobacteriaceae bacterium YJPT1-3]